MLAWFLAADALVVGLYVLVAATVPVREVLFFMFDLNQEANFPSWYSSVQLLLVAIAMLALASPLFRDVPEVSALRRLWLVLGCGFVYLSADEGAVVHERASQILVQRQAAFASVLRALGMTAKLRGGGVWIAVYAVVGLALVALLAPTIRPTLRTWPRQSLLFFAGFGLLFAGGIVVEGVSGVLHLAGAAHLAEVALEEGLEFVGQTVLLVATTSVIAAAAVMRETTAQAPPAEAGVPEELPLAQ